METKRLLIVGEIGWNWSDAEKLKVFQLDAAPLEVFIDSQGGSVTAGNSFSALLRAHAQNYNVEVKTIGIGLVASIATSVLLAGTNVQMDEQALMIIHNPSVDWFSGDAEAMRQTADTLDVIKNNLVDMYVKRIEKSGKSTDKTRKEVEKMMNAETWMTAKQALELGFIDSVQSFANVAAEAQTIIQSLPAQQTQQYQTIVNKFNNQNQKKSIMSVEKEDEKGIIARFIALFKNNEAAPVAEVVPVAEVISQKTLAEMSTEELEAELLSRKPVAAPVVAEVVVDTKTVELNNKVAALEKELAIQKTAHIVNHTPAPVVALSAKEQELKDLNARLMSIPSVRDAFSNITKNK